MSTKFQKLWVSLDADEKRKLAEKSETSVAYLRQIAHGQRRAGRKTIGNLVKADRRINFGMFFAEATPASGQRPHAI